MSNEDRQAWRAYARAALTGFAATDEGFRAEADVIAGWAASSAEAALAEEKRRFPEEPPTGQMTPAEIEKYVGEVPHFRYKHDDVVRLVRAVRGRFAYQESDKFSEAMKPFEEIK